MHPTVVGKRCPHTNTSVLFVATDYITGDAFDIQACRDCGLVRTTPAPLDEKLGSYYPRGYHAGRRYRGLLEILPHLLNASRAQRLERANGGPGRVLEIGCGRGALLHELQTRGWTVIGTELNPSTAEFARSAYGLDVRAADVVELGLPDGTLDAVILWHVLEHLRDPAGVIDKVARLLRPGGWLLVSVPRFDSPLSAWAGSAWFQLDVPRHLNHFRLDVLRQLLEANNLKLVRMRHLTVEYDFFSFVQTVLNRLGFRTNLLFETLRKSEASMLGARDPGYSDRRARLASLALAVPLTALSLAWQPIAAAMHRGDTVTMLAQKPQPPADTGT